MSRDNRPIIVEIPKHLAIPFVEAYCEKYKVPYFGDPNYGREVKWYGAISRRSIRAVLGLVVIPEGLYVLHFLQDHTVFGGRAITALNHFLYGIGIPLWAHIRKENPKMWERAIRDGAHVVGCTDEGELLLHNPLSQSPNLIQCQEGSTI